MAKKPQKKAQKRLWRRARKRTPTVLQMEATECGAACLAMVLEYFGRIVPLEILRQDCGVSRDGSNAYNIIKAARRYGMEAKGYKKSLEGLRELPLPLILFWNFNHFVVLDGIKGDTVYLNDPSSGPRTVHIDELNESFTGVVLSIKPGPEFKKGGRRPSLFGMLYRRLPGVRLSLAFVLLASLGLVVPGLIIPAFTGVFVDKILVSQSMEWYKPLLLGMGLTGLFRALLTWLQQRTLLRQETKLAVSASAKFFEHVFRLPYVYFVQRFGGEIGARVRINDFVATLLSGQLSTNALNLVTLVFFAGVMYTYDKPLTILSVGIAGVNFVVLRWVSRKRSDLNKRLLQEQGKLMGTTMGGLQRIETLRASGGEEDYFTRWAGYQAKALNARRDLELWSQLTTPLPVFLMAVNTAAVIGVGGLRVMDGQMTIGMLVAYQSLMMSFLAPVGQLVALSALLQTAEGYMARLDDVLRHEPDPVFSKEAVPIKAGETPIRLSGALEIRNLTFGYSKIDAPLIKDFNLTLKAGARVALVGGSGSGKSTIVRLISGLFPLWDGEVLFDGKPADAYPREVMMHSVSFVDQEIFLFEGTVRDNIAMWNPGVPDEDVIRAAKDALIHEDVSTRGGGYESNVTEGGGNFSGGQRQRIEIARALATRPGILILDEATSALDSETEKAIDDNLRKRGCSCLIVAHRLSTIRDCDEIIVLEKGKVVERGTHEELMALGGRYKDLIEY